MHYSSYHKDHNAVTFPNGDCAQPSGTAFVGPSARHIPATIHSDRQYLHKARPVGSTSSMQAAVQSCKWESVWRLAERHTALCLYWVHSLFLLSLQVFFSVNRFVQGNFLQRRELKDVGMLMVVEQKLQTPRENRVNSISKVLRPQTSGINVCLSHIQYIYCAVSLW